jgi:putative tricarboxylic transport membrane protein
VITRAAIPLHRRLQGALPYVVVFAAAVFLYYSADRFEFEQAAGRIGPGAWPKLILILMLVAATWGIVSNLWGSKGATDERDADFIEDEDLVRPPEIHPVRVWLAVAATLAYLLLLPVFGFFLATIAFCLVLMILGEFRRPLPLALLSVGISAVFMFLFMRVVYVALPAGMAPFDHVSYALMAAMGVH